MKIVGPIPNHILKLMPKEDRAPLGNVGVTFDEAQEKQRLRSEKELQEQCASLLRQRNIWFARSRMDRKTSGTVGTPDFLFAVKGQAVAVECKFGDGKLSEEQIQAISAMQDPSNGWFCFVVHDLPYFQGVLNALEHK